MSRKSPQHNLSLSLSRLTWQCHPFDEGCGSLLAPESFVVVLLCACQRPGFLETSSRKAAVVSKLCGTVPFAPGCDWESIRSSRPTRLLGQAQVSVTHLGRADNP